MTHECDYPPTVVGKPVLTASSISHQTMSSSEIDHAVRSQLDGHGSIYELNEELSRELRPELVITQELCEVCAVSYKTVIRRRALDAGVRVVSLEPQTIEDIFANIRTVGELTGTEAEAEASVTELAVRSTRSPCSSLRSSGDRARSSSNGLSRRSRPATGFPNRSRSRAATTPSVRGRKVALTTAEEIRDYAPEVIVLAPCGYYKEDTLAALATARLPRGWHELPAVRAGEVWAVDATATSAAPGRASSRARKYSLRIIHPEIFGEPEEAEAVRVAADQMFVEEL